MDPDRFEVLFENGNFRSPKFCSFRGKILNLLVVKCQRWVSWLSENLD